MRERQLATSVSAYNYSPTELGVFVIHAECPADSAGAAARAIWGQVADLREHGVGDRELARAQRLLESGWVRRTESMEGQASYLAEWQALGDWALGDQYLERVLSVTPGEVTGAIRRYLDPDGVSAIVYRPAASPVVATGAHMLLAVGGGGAAPSADTTSVVSGELAGGDIAARRTRGRVQAEREVAGVRVYRTAAGVPILIAQKTGAQITHAGVFAFGGARDEGLPRGGLTTLMARCALKGAAGRSAAELADAVEMLGGSIGSSTGSENTGWSISVPARFTRRRCTCSRTSCSSRGSRRGRSRRSVRWRWPNSRCCATTCPGIRCAS